MEVKATARYIRMSPRKVRLVIDLIRGLGVKEAQSQLHVMKKAAAEPVKSFSIQRWQTHLITLISM